MIRLHTSFEGFEPEKNKINRTYVEVLKKIVRNAKKYDIYVLLDTHQDLLSRRFCGNGFPDWAMTVNESFPYPVRLPLERDAQGLPLISDCLKRAFSFHYFSYDIQNQYERLW